MMISLLGVMTFAWMAESHWDWEWKISPLTFIAFIILMVWCTHHPLLIEKIERKRKRVPHCIPPLFLSIQWIISVPHEWCPLRTYRCMIFGSNHSRGSRQAETSNKYGICKDSHPTLNVWMWVRPGWMVQLFLVFWTWFKVLNEEIVSLYLVSVILARFFQFETWRKFGKIFLSSIRRWGLQRIVNVSLGVKITRDFFKTCLWS